MNIIVTTDEDLKRIVNEAIEEFVSKNGGITKNVPTSKKADEAPDYETMPLLTRKEAATYLKVSVKTIQRLKISGKLPYVDIGGDKFNMKDLVDFKKKQLRSFK